MEQVVLLAVSLIGIPLLNSLFLVLLGLYYHEKFLAPIFKKLDNPSVQTIVEPQTVYLRSESAPIAKNLSDEERARMEEEVRHGY